jgi:hypothetical protein
MINGFQCFTLELPFKGNKPDVSSIPRGRYEYYKRISPKNGDVLELRNVPERTYIQIHAGNFTRQIQGCILVGDSIKHIDGDTIPDVSNSKKTLKKLLDKVSDRGYIDVY